MKRIFFVLCCIITFCYVGNRIAADQNLSGVMNAPLHLQHYPENNQNFMHVGVDVYWTFLDQVGGSQRPYLLAYSGGALILKPSDFRSPSANPDGPGVDLCIDPRITTTIAGSNTITYVAIEDPSLWFGAGHCDWDLQGEFDFVTVNEVQFLSPKDHSKLAGLQTAVRDAYLWGFASNRVITCGNALPSGAYVTQGNQILVPGISPGDKIAVMYDWGGTGYRMKRKHFHIDQYYKNGNDRIENLGIGNRLADYLRSVFALASATPQPPSISIGYFRMRENWRDWVCGSIPEMPLAETCLGHYVGLGDATPTPPLGFPTMYPTVVVFRDVDFLEDVAQVEGYKFADFDRIEFKINRIDRAPITPSGTTVATCHPSITNVIYATPYKAPNVEITDCSFGVTFPPHMPANTNIIAPLGHNGDYGYIFEMESPDGSYSGWQWAPSSWQNNPFTSEGGDNLDYGAFWILTNLHTKYSGPAAEFRLDPRDRYNCWNSNVHMAYTPGPSGGVGWWLPPETGTRTYPALYHSSGAPSHAPSLTNNQAYHPEYAYFPDGRYNVETKYVPKSGTELGHETADFHVDNFKPYLKYISVQQEQLDWNNTPTAWRDPDVSSDWLSLENTSTTVFSPYTGATKKYRNQYLAYLAYWRVKTENGVPTGSEPGRNTWLELCTHGGTGVQANPFLNWTASGAFHWEHNSTAKRWVHGRKPLLIELEFSEPIDENTFHFDLEDRQGHFRQMIAPSNTHLIPVGVTDTSEIFDYFDTADDAELGWCFKRGGGNRIVFLKIPALRLYLRYDEDSHLYQQSALFDAAERRMFIFAKDEAGTPIACLEPSFTSETRDQSCRDRICRDTDGAFEDAYGDNWIHRLSIDTVTEAKVWKNPVGLHNWGDVEAQIGCLEQNQEYSNILNWHMDYRAGTVWTEDWDPKRNIERQSLDGTWIRESAGSRETRTKIGFFIVDDRINPGSALAFPRIMTGRAVYVDLLPPPYVVYVESYTVDSIGNKDAAVAWIYDGGPPISTGPPTTFPSGSITLPPTTLPSGYTTLPPTGTLSFHATSAPVRTLEGSQTAPPPSSTVTVSYGVSFPPPSLSLEGLQGGGQEGEDNPTD